MKIFQSRVWLLVGIVTTLLFAGVLANPKFDYRTIELDQLLTAISESRVKEIRVVNSTTVLVIYNDETQVRTTKPADFNILEEADLGDSINKPFLYSEEQNPIGQVIRAGALIILPLIALITFYMFYIGRVNAAKAHSKATKARR